MSHEPTFVLHPDRQKLAFTFLACLGIDALAVYGFYDAANDEQSTAAFLASMALIGFGSLLFAFTTYFYGMQLFRFKPVLEFDEEGLINLTGFGDGRRIPWREIRKIEKVGSFISIFLQNPEPFVEATNNKFLKGVHRRNLRNKGTPVLIALRFVSINPMELEERLLKAWEMGKRAG